MLDLSRDDFKLGHTSGESRVYTVPEQHLPILQQGASRYQDAQAADAGQQYLVYSRFQNRHPVIDLPVPPRLRNSIVPIQDGLQRRSQAALRNEFSHLRYTPVTCDPFDFVDHGYQLRPELFVKPRQIEICIGITMYNEDDYLLGITLEALHRNIQALQHPNRKAPWGPNSWQKIVVCIISDGRAKINPRTRALLATLGIYQNAGMIRQHDGYDVVMHMFEYTTHSAIRINQGQVSVERDSLDTVPCQTVLCLKEKNQKKINSHRWFLTAICRALNPRVAVFLDAGSIPGPDSIYNLWRPLDSDDTVAAVTGFCRAVGSSRITPLVNMLVGFQKFEYQLTNTLERPVESLLGRRFAVNKGGFVAYRYSVVGSHHTADEDNVFGDYFDGERLNSRAHVSTSKANAYLTEDRAISSRLLRTNLRVWRTVSVDSAEVVADVPESMDELILQRRRWINGDFYSSLHELVSTFSYIRLRPLSIFTPFRVLGLLISVLYQAVTALLQYFAIGNAFAIFCVVTTSTGNSIYLGKAGASAALAMSYVYIFVFFAGLVSSLGSRPQASSAFYRWLILLWLIIYGYFLATTLYLIIQGSASLRNSFERSPSDVLTDPLCMFIAWPVVAISAIWLVAPLALLRKPHSLSSCIYYPAFLPVYTNLITMYAKCNSHDITFGVMGNTPAEVLPSARYPPNMSTGGENSFDISYDELNGDMIIRGYDEYINQLDLFHEQQGQLHMTKAIPEVAMRSPSDKQMDYFRQHRLLMVLMWIGLNSALVMVVVNIPTISTFTPTTEGGRGLAYVGTVLWAYAGISGFQFCCTILYGVSKISKW